MTQNAQEITRHRTENIDLLDLGGGWSPRCRGSGSLELAASGNCCSEAAGRASVRAGRKQPRALSSAPHQACPCKREVLTIGSLASFLRVISINCFTATKAFGKVSPALSTLAIVIPHWGASHPLPACFQTPAGASPVGGPTALGQWWFF